MLKLTQTDGGKVAEGFEHETNDCGVRALALAAGLTYREAHDMLKAQGRRDRKGTNIRMLENAMTKAGIKFEKIVSCRTVPNVARRDTAI